MLNPERKKKQIRIRLNFNDWALELLGERQSRHRWRLSLAAEEIPNETTHRFLLERQFRSPRVSGKQCQRSKVVRSFPPSRSARVVNRRFSFSPPPLGFFFFFLANRHHLFFGNFFRAIYTYENESRQFPVTNIITTLTKLVILATVTQVVISAST